MAVHSEMMLEPIAIPVASSVSEASNNSRSVKLPRKSKRTSYTSISQSSLQRLQQYNSHPLSDEYVPGNLFGSYDDEDLALGQTQSSLDTFYSDDESDDSFSSYSTSGSFSATPKSFETMKNNPPHLFISPPHASLNVTVTAAVSHEFKPASPPEIKSSPSTDSLINLLNGDKKNTSRFNISSSLRNWKSWFPYSSLSPRMTDDLIPVSAYNQTPANQIDVLESKELTTFKLDIDDLSQENVPVKKTFKNRDQRINSAFLRLYAADYCARTITRTLPNSNYSGQDNSELVKMVASKPQLKHFHYVHNIYRISSMSRDKLWSSIILEPRMDHSPNQCIDASSYIYVGDDHSPSSVIRQSGKNYLPWDTKTTKNTTFAPAGVIQNGTVKLNGLAPSSGVTKTQFTVKGWCNPRWIDQT